MFTGIIEAVGKIHSIEPRNGDMRLYVKTGPLDLADVILGDSIAVNGVCLTVVELPGDGFWADVSRETMTSTCFSSFKTGSPINLEKALMAQARLGGHLVSGHVDGFGEVVNRYHDGGSVRFTLKAPDELAKYICHKGSICIDGISLTVTAVNGSQFGLNIVPHTLNQTIMDNYRVGTKVNLEIDQIARYLERLILSNKAAEMKIKGINMDLLKNNGFV